MSIEFGPPELPDVVAEKGVFNVQNWWVGRPELATLYLLDLQEKNGDNTCYGEYLHLNGSATSFCGMVYDYKTNALATNNFEYTCNSLQRYKFALLFLTNFDQGKSHANAVVLDSVCKTMVRFEPHGKKFQYNGIDDMDDKLDLKFKELAETFGVTYVAPRDYEKDTIQKSDPTCVAFCVLFIEYVIRYSSNIDTCVDVKTMAGSINEYLTNEKALHYAANIRIEYANLFTNTGNSFNAELARQKIKEKADIFHRNTSAYLRNLASDNVDLKTFKSNNADLSKFILGYTNSSKMAEGQKTYSLPWKIMNILEIFKLEDFRVPAQNTDPLLKILSQAPKLKYLILKNSALNDEGATTICENTNITHMGLNQNNIGDEGAKALAKSNVITHLDVSGNNIGDAGVEALSKNRTITHLSIAGNTFRDALEQLSTNDVLEHLVLGWYHKYHKYKTQKLIPFCITDDVARNLAKNTSLKKLIIDQHATMNDVGFEAISQSTLVYFTWNQCSWNHANIEALARSKTITHLSLLFCTPRIDDQAAEILARNTKITHLLLRHSNIGDVGATALSKNTKITHLDLGLSEVSSEGLGSLSTNTTITHLYVSSTSIDQDAADAFAKNTTCINITIKNVNVFTGAVFIKTSADEPPWTKENAYGLSSMMF